MPLARAADAGPRGCVWCVRVKGTKLGVPAQYFASGPTPRWRRPALPSLGLVREGWLHHTSDRVPAHEARRRDVLRHRHRRGLSNLAASMASATASAQPDARSTGSRNRACLRDDNTATRDAGFGPEVKWRDPARHVRALRGYHDAYYLKACRVRHAHRARVRAGVPRRRRHRLPHRADTPAFGSVRRRAIRLDVPPTSTSLFASLGAPRSASRRAREEWPAIGL